jgi:hypothetical protein
MPLLSRNFEDYNIDQFTYLRDNEIIPTKLFLGRVVNIPYMHKTVLVPKLLSDEKLIVHQTAGYLCNQVYLHGFYLNVNEEYREKISNLADELEKEYFESSLSSPPILNEALKYRRFLLKNDFDCNFSYKHLQEALYPIDNTNNVIKKLCHGVPEEITSESFGLYYDIFILGYNCD